MEPTGGSLNREDTEAWAASQEPATADCAFVYQLSQNTASSPYRCKLLAREPERLGALDEVRDSVVREHAGLPGRVEDVVDRFGEGLIGIAAGPPSSERRKELIHCQAIDTVGGRRRDLGLSRGAGVRVDGGGFRRPEQVFILGRDLAGQGVLGRVRAGALDRIELGRGLEV